MIWMCRRFCGRNGGGGRRLTKRLSAFGEDIEVGLVGEEPVAGLACNLMENVQSLKMLDGRSRGWEADAKLPGGGGDGEDGMGLRVAIIV